jgi:hypothetical protein
MAAAGDRVLVAGGDDEVHAYDEALERVASYEAPDWLRGVAVSPSGAAFAAAGAGGVVIRSLPDGQEIASLQPEVRPQAVAWCGGQLHVGGVGGVVTYDDPVGR